MARLFLFPRKNPYFALPTNSITLFKTKSKKPGRAEKAVAEPENRVGENPHRRAICPTLAYFDRIYSFDNIHQD
jgi:hypothetical protein